MKIKNVAAVYISPTGTTEMMVKRIAGNLAEGLDVPMHCFSCTRPEMRKRPLIFTEQDLVVLGSPVYAGRVPNLMLPFLQSIQGHGALGVPIVLYGNRSYDDGLIELKKIMETDGFYPIAAAAFVGQHSFSNTLAYGQPDDKAFALSDDFSEKILQKISSEDYRKEEDFFSVTGNDPIGPYFKPRDADGNPIDIRKVKPKTANTCIHCGKCADLCPMGAIDFEDVKQITGICIKCHACVKGCPQRAKYFDDTAFLFHKQDIEKRFASPIHEPDCFL